MLQCQVGLSLKVSIISCFTTFYRWRLTPIIAQLVHLFHFLIYCHWPLATFEAIFVLRIRCYVFISLRHYFTQLIHDFKSKVLIQDKIIFVWNQYSLFHCMFYCVSHITWLLHYATLLLGGILPNSTRDFLTELHCIIVISWFPVSLFFYCLDPYFITIPILSSNIYIVIPV